MTLLKKTTIFFAATTMLVAPVAASAAPAFDGARAISTASGQSALEGDSSWLIGLVGLLAGLTALILAADDNDDEPVSP